eukprot:1364594-Amorphochlora_amoeboformis.AAC.1
MHRCNIVKAKSSGSSVSFRKFSRKPSNFSKLLEAWRGVICRDVTLCHGTFLESGSAWYYTALPDTTGKVISEESPGYLAISGIRTTTLSH